jgi:hypothetical protein
MNIQITTIPDLIDTLGGPAKFGRIIGRGASTASEMKRRESIPVEHWPVLIASPEGRAFELTADDLMRLHTVSLAQPTEAA